MNSYFQFKQFRVEQGRCAMKVTTDACIQGAWTPLQPQVRRVLDVGSGTGLLALMLAQRSADVQVDAVELDPEAAAEADANVLASPWKERINVIAGDARQYVASEKYDLIISNPPFFRNSLPSITENKRMARHTGSLAYMDLLEVIAANLADDGYISILLPDTEYAIWIDLLHENGWSEFERLSVRHRPGAGVKRVVGLFRREAAGTSIETDLVISNEEGYSSDFRKLLSPFYLDL